MNKENAYTQWDAISRKENGILAFAAKWMELEPTMLSGVSQAQKDKYHASSLWRLTLIHRREGQWLPAAGMGGEDDRGGG